jgi:hypothetical protein
VMLILLAHPVLVPMQCVIHYVCQTNAETELLNDFTQPRQFRMANETRGCR